MAPAVPIKPQYGPTLGHLLSPRWHAASPLARRLVIASGVGLLLVALAAVLTFENAKYSQGGRVPFSFSYRGLYRVPAGSGEYVRVQRRGSGGQLEDSFAVQPLELPPYSGELSGELPLYASRYMEALSRSYADFRPRGEGKTRVNGVPAYNIFYTADVEGRPMLGRDVLLLPERAGARGGVVIVMLVSPAAAAPASSPLEVGGAGLLSRPLKSFSIG